MRQVDVQSLSKTFGPTYALDDVTLGIEAGEFVALLGPSGCGKTTLLRLIAGLERPSSGSISLSGRTVANGADFVDPEDRHLGMVFQSYALWPHMSVEENVAFGLKVRRLPKDERALRVESALAAVGLAGFEKRRPHALSGGQRQRVALARCLAMEPGIILLDEPLANLDAHLRASMQAEFRRIHRETGTTFVFVTHDQSEAMALADRIIVMDKGRLQQSGAPEELYARPETGMVARFIGRGAALPVTVEAIRPDGMRQVRLAGRTLHLPGNAAIGAALASLRPEHVTLAAPETSETIVPARVAAVVYQGGYYAATLELAVGVGLLETRSHHRLQVAENVHVAVHGGWVLAADGTA
jgi:iron(III) transport system ATP-binding protein